MMLRFLRDRLSRRALLRGAAAVATFALAAPARAQIKISQSAVGYEDHPNGNRRCALCIHFIPPNKCQLISGEISPQGWCRVFAPMSGQAGTLPARGPAASA